MNRLSSHLSQSLLLLNEKDSCTGIGDASFTFWSPSPAACTGFSRSWFWIPFDWTVPFTMGLSWSFSWPSSAYTSFALPFSFFLSTVSFDSGPLSSDLSFSSPTSSSPDLLSSADPLCPFSSSLLSFPRDDSVEIRIVGTADTGSSALPFASAPETGCRVGLGAIMPRVDAWSSIEALTTVPSSCITALPRSPSRDESVGSENPLVEVADSTCWMSPWVFCMRYSSSMTKTWLRVFKSSSQPICETSRVSKAYALAQVPRRPGAGKRSNAGSHWRNQFHCKKK